MTEYYTEYYNVNTALSPLRQYYIRELNENSQKVKEDIGSNIILKDHQLTLLNKCIELESNKYMDVIYDDVNLLYSNIQTIYGVLADKTGSGKSYVILSLIILHKSLKRIQKNINRIGCFVTCNKTE